MFFFGRNKILHHSTFMLAHSCAIFLFYLVGQLTTFMQAIPTWPSTTRRPWVRRELRSERRKTRARLSSGWMWRLWLPGPAWSLTNNSWWELKGFLSLRLARMVRGTFFPHLPVWQLKPFGQCPYKTNTFKKGASLSIVSRSSSLWRCHLHIW